MNSHSKHSAQATISLYSMRGKSWSYYQKHVANLIDFDNDPATLASRTTADVQRLELVDSNLYGESPSDPGPMVLCNQCNHVMAPEGIMRHVKRVHGSKIIPAPSNKLRIPSKGNSAAGTTIPIAGSPNIGRISNPPTPQPSDSNLSSEFSNRLNVSKMAPPTPLSTDLENTANSMSSNSNSPISLSKLSTSTSGSGNGSSNRRNRKVLPVKDREYDPEKHCGVRIGNMKPCTRSLTCKTHQVSLRRNVEGRSKPFDQLLAEHRNNAKETHKHSTSKQTNYAIGDSGSQLLESIGDSNSSSSFDMERRSFSSNSNQSTLGNYNSDQSTALSSSSQQMNGTHSLPSVLSSLSGTVTSGSNTNFMPSDIGTLRKSGNVMSFTPSPDDRSNNASQIDLTLSAIQSGSVDNNPLSTSGLSTSASLTSLGEYSMNELMNDENGDGLDMTFWSNFDNFNYDADFATSSNCPQGRAGNKRPNDGINSDRKRKRMNEGKGGVFSKDSSHLKCPSQSLSPLPTEVGPTLLKAISGLSQTRKTPSGKTGRRPHRVVIDSPNEVICIDDDEDDATNNNIDATVNRNSDKENGTTYTVTPTKDPSNNSSAKQTTNRGLSESDAPTVNGKQSLADRLLTAMTLSNDPFVSSIDLVNVTKILSETDHKSPESPSKLAAATIPPSNPSNHRTEAPDSIDNANKKQESDHSLLSVPIGVNETFLLDMVYKCLRGKGVRMLNSNFTNSASRAREKENTSEYHWSDDDVPTIPVSAPNCSIYPSTQRFSSSKCAHMPRAINANRFNMARGRGVCHAKHTIDSTHKVQQQYLYRTNIQTHQHNGTFANNMVALRNNGAIMRLNSANLIGNISTSNIGSISNAVSIPANNVTAAKTTMANTNTVNTANVTSTPTAVAVTNSLAASTSTVNAAANAIVAATTQNSPNASNTSNTTTTPANTSNTSIPSVASVTSAAVNAANVNNGAKPAANAPPNIAAKVAFKKPVHFLNSIGSTGNGPIVLLNPGGAGAMNTAGGNARYAIFRRPILNQSIQMLPRQTFDPTNSHSVMPMIHRIQTRKIKPNLPKVLETDRLIDRQKKSQKFIHANYDKTKEVMAVYQLMLKSANQSIHLSASTNNSSSSKRKSHSSLSNHKNSTNHKQNGHSNSSSNGAILISGSSYISSHASTNSTSNHVDKRTHIRIAGDTNHK